MSAHPEQPLADYLRPLYGPQVPEGHAIVMSCLKRNVDGGAFINPEFCTNFRAVRDYILEYRDTYDVYNRVSLISADAATTLIGSQRGGEEHSSLLPALYTDVDYEKNGVAEEEALALLNDLPLPPSLVARSGGGLHPYWILREPWLLESAEDREEAKALLAAWGRYVKERVPCAGDNVWELSRMLRPPCSLNRKPEYGPEGRRVELLLRTDRRYNASDFEQWVPADYQEAAKAPAPPLETDASGMITEESRHRALLSTAGRGWRMGLTAPVILDTLRSMRDHQCSSEGRVITDGELEKIVEFVTSKPREDGWKAAWEWERGSASPNGDPALTVDEVISKLGKVEDAKSATEPLRALAKALAGADKLTRQVARERAIAALKGKVSSHAALVDAALDEAISDPTPPQPGAFSGLDPDRLARQPEVAAEEALDAVGGFLDKYVSFPSEHARNATVLWVAHTWVIDELYFTPRLNPWAAQPGSGKSRVLECLELLCPNAVAGESLTPAVIYRVVAKGHKDGLLPTLLLDEAHLIFKGSKDSDEAAGLARAVVNSGYNRRGSVWRCNANTNEPERFPSFAPMAVAGLKRFLPDDTQTRSISYQMQPRNDGTAAEWIEQDVPYEAAPIAAGMAKWAESVRGTVQDARPVMPPGIRDRVADTWRSILRAGDLAGGEWAKRGRDACLGIVKSEREADTRTNEVKLLANTRDLFEGRSAMCPKCIAEGLNANDEWQWGGWFDGNGVKVSWVKTTIRGFDEVELKPKPIRCGACNRSGIHGFHHKKLESIWQRYADASPGVDSEGEDTPPQEGGDSAQQTQQTQHGNAHGQRDVENVENVELNSPGSEGIESEPSIQHIGSDDEDEDLCDRCLRDSCDGGCGADADEEVM